MALNPPDEPNTLFASTILTVGMARSQNEVIKAIAIDITALTKRVVTSLMPLILKPLLPLRAEGWHPILLEPN